MQKELKDFISGNIPRSFDEGGKSYHGDYIRIEKMEALDGKIKTERDEIYIRLAEYVNENRLNYPELDYFFNLIDDIGEENE